MLLQTIRLCTAAFENPMSMRTGFYSNLICSLMGSRYRQCSNTSEIGSSESVIRSRLPSQKETRPDDTAYNYCVPEIATIVSWE